MPDWKPKANEDRNGIVEYIAQDSARAAIETGDMLLEKAALLDDNP